MWQQLDEMKYEISTLHVGYAECNTEGCIEPLLSLEMMQRYESPSPSSRTDIYTTSTPEYFIVNSRPEYLMHYVGPTRPECAVPVPMEEMENPREVLTVARIQLSPAEEEGLNIKLKKEIYEKRKAS